MGPPKVQSNKKATIQLRRTSRRKLMPKKTRSPTKFINRIPDDELESTDTEEESIVSAHEENSFEDSQDSSNDEVVSKDLDSEAFSHESDTKSESDIEFTTLEKSEDIQEEPLIRLKHVILFIFVFVTIFALLNPFILKWNAYRHEGLEPVGRHACHPLDLDTLTQWIDSKAAQAIENLLLEHRKPLSLYIMKPSHHINQTHSLVDHICKMSTGHPEDILRVNAHQSDFKQSLLTQMKRHASPLMRGCYNKVVLVYIPSNQPMESIKDNLIWLESAMDDTISVLHTHEDQDIETNNWLFLFVEMLECEDTLDPLNARNLSLGKRVSDRWIQRITQIVV